ncbi:ROK family transcriptional regulator [Cellulomonas triticagri]|uniref:ROK family transcriptional regulator n=1 Tax=Cellulomonas triticagri TaxID=2483352 RepID=A0A3M2J679_9CELL|nr:ROK family transcriptional regulator [Cellulomonas triticagri]RMI09612.1 ROK family transcriptional regulator [Cellulomonas triticagri]
MRRGTNLPRMGDYNQTVVLDVIRRAGGGLARAEVARRTGLSPQTLTNVARRLLDLGLVVEEGEAARRGPGRPGTLMRLNPLSRFAVGVHLDPATMTFVLLDLSGAVVARAQSPTPVPEDPDAVVDGLVAEIEGLISRAGVDRDRVLGVGIAAPGPIDVEAGVVLDPPHLPGWHDVPLRDAVAERTGLRAVLDKDVIAAACAHLWAPGGGAAEEVEHPSDFVFVYLGTGVAVSTVLRDEVVRGVSGNAGESGHLVADPDGAPCWCGRRGCLGAVLRAEALAEQGRAAGVDLPGWGDGSDPRAVDDAVTALAAAADAGDPAAREVLRVAGRRIGMAAGVLTDLLDVPTVLVGGPLWDRIAAHAGPALRAEVAAHPVPGGHAVSVMSSAFGPQVGAVGAGCILLGRAFAPRPTDLLLVS